ncbi:MAG TPA: VOC family protein [Bacteroidia bacterium]|nr:VOC family protein [Bacteroidia bacterium]HNT80946.1 VOC family protein [Bacteroidia bacterium]
MGTTITKKAPTKKKKKKIKDYVSWFEIPALNFERAKYFYNQVFDIDMETVELNGYAMAFFPAAKGIGGAVVAGPGSVPGESGPLIYLNGGEDLNEVLQRVDDAGGRVIMGKTLINEEYGYFALFIDSEGNKLALHSNQ